MKAVPMPRGHKGGFYTAFHRSPWGGVGLALGLVGLAVLFRFFFLDRTLPFVLFYPAVIIAAHWGGLRPGLTATAASAIASCYFFGAPQGLPFQSSAEFWFELALFMGAGVLLSLLSERRLQTLGGERHALASKRASAERERLLKEQLEGEKQFVADVLTSIDDAICVIGWDWRIIYANRPMAALTGEKWEALEGKNLWELFPHQEPLDRPHLEKAMRERVPVRFETHDQKAGRWLQVGAFPCQKGITVYAMDVSERKKVEKRSEAAQQELSQQASHLEKEVHRRTGELRETVAQLESLSYTVSHDLRSPLRAMQAFAHMTLAEEGDRLSETGRDYLKRIDAAAQRMDKLIQDVIIFNKVGRVEMPLEPVNTETLVEEVIQQYPSVNKPHAAFEIQRPLDRVVANPPALVQALANILSNAVKFVHSGQQAFIKVSTHKHDSKVCLCIEDKGIGIEPESMPKIFEPFHRAHPSGGYEGNGIGLAVAKRAVERMGGTIQAESEVGKGSRFYIELPAA